jgi:hypothetical protein
MPHWEINDIWDVLGLVFIVLIIVGGSVLVLLRRKISFGFTKKEPNLTVENSATPIMDQMSPQVPECNYILEHATKLDTLDRSIRAMRKEVKVLYKLMNPIILTLKANLELAIGKQQNGQVTKALEAITSAEELFNTTLIDKIDEN